MGKDFSGQDLKNKDFSEQDLSGANLKDKDLSGANLERGNLSGTTYNYDTIWPEGFNPQEHGAILVENED